MTLPAQKMESTSLPDEHRFGTVLAYVRALMWKYPGQIEFSTGAGHIYADVMKHLPPIEGHEEDRRIIGHLIEEHAYPLAASLYAQAVNIVLTVSAEPLGPPAHIDALASFTAFDAEDGILRHGFLSPHHFMPDLLELTIPCGMTVECEPLNYHYHQIKDDSTIFPRNGASNVLSHAYAGRDKDPEGGYASDRKPAPGPEGPAHPTQFIPRWILEPAPGVVVVPRVAGVGGATHVPSYIRLLRVSPHHHIYEPAALAWKWSPKTEPAPLIALPEVKTASALPIVKPMNSKPEPQPRKAIHYTFPAPGLSPLWLRPAE